MRREMIEALGLPRCLIQQSIEDRSCPNVGVFDATNQRCNVCDLNSECHWITCLYEFSDFERQPTYTISASLRYGVRLVESFLGDLDHDEAICTCSACSWLRDAQRLIEEFESSLPPNPYRPAH